MRGYRCDSCGTFHDGKPPYYLDVADPEIRYERIDLCAECGPSVVSPLIALGETSDPEFIASMGEARTGAEHDASHDAQWTPQVQA